MLKFPANSNAFEIYPLFVCSSTQQKPYHTKKVINTLSTTYIADNMLDMQLHSRKNKKSYVKKHSK